MSAAAQTYGDALDLIEAMCASDPPEVHPDRTTGLLTHGQRTNRAIVLLHGLTNGPPQWRALAPHFFESGYNVFLPRMPHHGYANRMTEDLKNLTIDEMKQWGSQIVEIAQGLGEHLTVVGLSASGVLSLWLGHTRPEIDLAVGVAPAFAARGLSVRLQKALNVVVEALPNLFVWWDPRQRENLQPEHVYPRFSTHAVARGFRLGSEVLALSEAGKPASKRQMVIASRGDPSLNNAVARRVIDNWKLHGADAEYHAPDWGAIHDIIDPGQSYAKIDEVYPVLIELIAGQAT